MRPIFRDQPMNWQLSNIFVAIRLFSWFAEDEYKTFVECLNWILNCVYLSTCVIEFLWYLDWLPCKEISARNGKSGEALKDPIAHSLPPPSWNVTKRGYKKRGRSNCLKLAPFEFQEYGTEVFYTQDGTIKNVLRVLKDPIAHYALPLSWNVTKQSC